MGLPLVTPLVARHIIELARSGVRTQEALCSLA
jgi:hypothetical protein